MRTLVSLVLLLGFASSLAAQQHRQSKRTDIVQTAVKAGSFKTLVAAVKAADLVEVLRGKGPLTVFAPSDDAFAKLPKGTVESLLRPANRDTLKRILTYHVFPGRVDAKRASKLDQAMMLSGDRIAIRKRHRGLRIDKSNVVKADIECSNGLIHVIDRVLLPSGLDLGSKKTGNIVEVAQKAGQFSTLIAAAKAAGLAGALTGDKNLTVFAPTDEAFARLPKGTVASLLKPENKAKLAAILTYHVVSGRVTADAAIGARRAETLLPKAKLRFGITDGRLRVAGDRSAANVVKNDVDASNGVIHVIDTVLLPAESLLPKPAPKGRKVIGIYSDRPSKALASQLRLDRNNSMLLTSVKGNAKKAGLRAYDIITGIGGHPANDKTLRRAKEKAGAGGKIELDIVREGRRHVVTVTVGIETH